MPTFAAKEREVAPDADRPGAKIPEADQDALRYMGEAGFYLYRHDKHDERDFLRPGYLDSIIKENPASYAGALILYTMGGGRPDPEDWQSGIVRVARVRGSRGYAAEAPSLVAIVTRFGKATLVAHDGGAVEDDPKDKAAA